MAVPPADDGALADIPADAQPRSTFTLITAVAAVVALACLVFLGIRFAQADGGAGDRVRHVLGLGSSSGGAADESAQRETVMSQATQFMLRVNTYGPEDLDDTGKKLPGYISSVHEVITPKLAVDFDKNVTLAEQTVSQAGYARSAQIFSSGVETIDSDSADVLVAGVLESSYPDDKKEGRQAFPPEPFRVRVSLVLVEGTWLVDTFEPVTDTVEQGPSAGDPPTTAPSAPQTTQPGGGQGTGKPSGQGTGRPGAGSTGKPGAGKPTARATGGAKGAGR